MKKYIWVFLIVAIPTTVCLISQAYAGDHWGDYQSDLYPSSYSGATGLMKIGGQIGAVLIVIYMGRNIGKDILKWLETRRARAANEKNIGQE